MSLLEALNGPPQVTVRSPINTDVTDNADTDAAHAAEILNRSVDSKCSPTESNRKNNLNPPEVSNF